MLKSESYKKGLFVSTGLNIVAKGIGFINTVLVAFYFGSNISTDIYFYVLSVAVLITSTINGIDYLVLIPEAMRIRENETDKKSQQFLNFFVWLYGAIGLLITIAIIFSPVLFFTLFSKFDQQSLVSNNELLYIGSIIIVFQLLNNLLNAILVSYKYFTIPIITGLINSVFAIVLTIIYHDKFGIVGTILGISIGYIINFLLLVYIMIRQRRWSFSKLIIVSDSRVWKNIGLMQLNILPVWIRNYIVIFLLSGLGAGIITSVNLGQMLALLPEVFILSQMASVIGIRLSELSAKRDFAGAGELLGNLVNSLYVLLVPIAITMAVAHKEIIDIVFQRGDFSQNSAVTTAFCFFYFALILPSKIYDVAFTRLFTSFQVYGFSTALAIIGHFIITALTYIGITYFELQGYFFSIIIGYYAVMPIIFYLILKFRFRQLIRKELIKNFLVTILSVPLLLFAFQALYMQLSMNVFLKLGLLFVFSVIAVGLIAYYLLDLKYFWTFVNQIKQKIKSYFPA